jgi:hypothetical protein
LDSTPLEASRYSKNSEFNPHYNCKMDKAHITMIGTYPVFMTYTGGIAGDSPELSSHIDALLQMNAKIDEYRLDGAYDSFQNHADIWWNRWACILEIRIWRIKPSRNRTFSDESVKEYMDI